MVIDIYTIFRSYFLRVVEVQNNAIIFDSQLNKNCQYKCPRSYLHYFVTDNKQVGLQFSNQTEAVQFRKLIEEKLIECKLRRSSSIIEVKNDTSRSPVKSGSLDSPLVEGKSSTPHTFGAYEETRAREKLFSGLLPNSPSVKNNPNM